MSVTSSPPFTLRQLVTVFRERADDLPGDVVDDVAWENDDAGLLWSNAEVAQYADEAQSELYRRIGGLRDDSTEAITQIAVEADTHTYPYDRRILAIERVKFVEDNGSEFVLRKRSHEWMDEYSHRWQRTEPGRVDFYIEDADERRLRLWRPPLHDGTLHLTVRRLPLTGLDWRFRHKALEAPPEHHYALIDFMLHRAYMKRDAETENPELSTHHLELFTLNVGERPSARLERVRREESKAKRRVRAHFF